mgnify:CR=1 FL=1
MLETGQVLHQRYQLKQKLGQNAGRQTWKAENIATFPTKSVILKLLAFSPQMEWDNLKLFEREASILKHLNHPLIPQYCDYFSISSHILWFGLVHTYIPGKSLKNLLEEGRRFSETEVNNIAASILDILIYLHELSPTVLHRDIKPSNIILGEDQKVYLVDFGAVQARAAIEGATFTIVGTYGYTPMEQFGGRTVPASDIYALGATLIHLLTGTPPADLPQSNMRIQFRQYLSISSHLIDWIEILTHPNVEWRFSTAREALTALDTPQIIQQKHFISQKPPKSKIRLKKTSFQLEVKIPCRGIRVRDSFIIIWIIVLYGATIPFSFVTFPFVILYWLLGFVAISFLIFIAFGQVNLCFDRKCFAFEWKLLGLRYRLVKGYTAIIQDIQENTVNPVQPDSENPTHIEIKVGHRKYQLCGITAPISAVERQWLIQQIKEWLGFI